MSGGAIPAPAGDVREPVEISNAERLVKVPLVSVLMITYNHAAYLAEAIEGVLSQECDFPFELIIGEDSSTDGTRQIALEYQQRHPEIIRIVHSSINVGVKPNALRILARARGKFVAYCEGDDYWCFPQKLARQISMIRNDEDVGIVHSDWVRSRRVNGKWLVDWRHPVQGRVPSRLLQGDLFRTFHYPKILRTCTVLLRKQTVDEFMHSELGNTRFAYGDVVRATYVTSRWQVAWLPEVTAVYRHSDNSVLRSGIRARLHFLQNSLRFDTEARRFFSDRLDYPHSYRWEVSVGLLLWALRSREMDVARFALRDMRANFGVLDFAVAGWQCLRMRFPMLRRRVLRDTIVPHGTPPPAGDAG